MSLIVGGGLIGLARCLRACATRGDRARVRSRRAGSRRIVGRRRHARAVRGAHRRQGHAGFVQHFARAISSVRAARGRGERRQCRTGARWHRRGGVRCGALEELAAFARELAARNVACEMLDRRAALLAEPALGKHVLGALLIGGQGYVDNRRLGRALLAACRAKGVIVHAPVADVAIECDERRVLGVRSALGFAPASIVINAAGAWAAQIPGVPRDGRRAGFTRERPDACARRARRFLASCDMGAGRVPRAAHGWPTADRCDGRRRGIRRTHDRGGNRRASPRRTRRGAIAWCVHRYGKLGRFTPGNAGWTAAHRAKRDRRLAVRDGALPQRNLACSGYCRAACEFCRNGRRASPRRIRLS